MLMKRLDFDARDVVDTAAISNASLVLSIMSCKLRESHRLCVGDTGKVHSCSIGFYSDPILKRRFGSGTTESWRQCACPVPTNRLTIGCQVLHAQPCSHTCMAWRQLHANHASHSHHIFSADSLALWKGDSERAVKYALHTQNCVQKDRAVRLIATKGVVVVIPP